MQYSFNANRSQAARCESVAVRNVLNACKQKNLGREHENSRPRLCLTNCDRGAKSLPRYAGSVPERRLIAALHTGLHAVDDDRAVRVDPGHVGVVAHLRLDLLIRERDARDRNRAVRQDGSPIARDIIGTA